MAEESKRGPLVIFAIIIIGFLVIMVGFMQSFSLDNDKLQGRYEGTAAYPNWGYYNLKIDFDGEGRCNGTFSNASMSISFQQDYQVLGEEFVLTFINGTNYYLFEGFLEEKRVHGASQLRIENLIINGTFEIEAEL